MDLPPDMAPDEFDRMITRHLRQLAEHCLGVAIVCLRVEDGGKSGVYFRTGGNAHAAEKAVEDFAEERRIRRETRFRKRAEAEFEASNPPPPRDDDPGESWKG